jgi:predicted flap endonuclease-1-like 5' DNA nuclease
MSVKSLIWGAWLGPVCALVCALWAAGMVAPAQAGHYFLDDIDIIPAPITVELKTLGIDSTEALLLKTLTEKDRQTLDSAVSLSLEEIQQLAQMIELMQIDGVGPKAAKLLRAAGVTSAKSLSAMDPSVLLDQVVAANAKVRYTEVNPDLFIVEDWVRQAKDVQHHVQ